MGVFDKISTATGKIKRKMFDYQIGLSGTESKVVLFKLTSNKYSDSEVEIVDHFVTSVVFDIPGEIPIDRLRKKVTLAPAQTQSVFLYDVLPIQIYSRFEDNIERGDILVQKIFMDDDEYYMVLEVADTLGNLVGRQIIYKKQNAAPYTKNLPQEVVSILNSYKGLINKAVTVSLNNLTMNIDITPDIYLDMNRLLLNVSTNKVTIIT